MASKNFTCIIITPPPSRILHLPLICEYYLKLLEEIKPLENFTVFMVMATEYVYIVVLMAMCSST